jgi:hypothetical protein
MRQRSDILRRGNHINREALSVEIASENGETVTSDQQWCERLMLINVSAKAKSRLDVIEKVAELRCSKETVRHRR